MVPPDKETAKSIAVKALKTLYSEFSDKGLLALYLWGSSVRDDYDPATSEIDVLAITDDSFDPSLRRTIKEHLESENPQIHEFGFQNVYLSELNGAPPESVLIRLQSPGYLLKSFPDWQWICGRQFKRQDFSSPDFNVDQMIGHNIAEADRAVSNINDPGRKPNANRIDLVKALLMLTYWRSVKGGNTGKLNLSQLPQVAVDSDHNIALTLLEMRQNKIFSANQFAKRLPQLTGYLETARGAQLPSSSS